MKKQNGYINFDFILPMAILSVIGVIALVGGTGYAIWWVIKHISILIA